MLIIFPNNINTARDVYFQIVLWENVPMIKWMLNECLINDVLMIFLLMQNIGIMFVGQFYS